MILVILVNLIIVHDLNSPDNPLIHALSCNPVNLINLLIIQISVSPILIILITLLRDPDDSLKRPDSLTLLPKRGPNLLSVGPYLTVLPSQL